MIKVSDGIKLKLLSEQDASDIFRILDSEREYMRIWLPFVDHSQKVTDTENAIKPLIDGINKQFCIYYQDQFVGLVGFKDTDQSSRRTEIGYWLSQTAQGKGVMTRSVVALINHAFETMDMNRIQIRVAVGNKPSRAIPEKLGFVQEGVERDGELLVDNKYTDIVVYSLLKREYKKQ